MAFATSLLLCLSAAGCMTPWFAKKNENRTAEGEFRDSLKEKLLEDERPRLIVEIASPAMLTQTRIENIGLVTQLHGTGGPVRASSQREKILDTMRRLDVEQPNTLLDDESTALTVATAVVPPAARKGQALDIIIRKSSHSEATSLEHGWLMETPLTEMSVLEGRIREGFDLAKVQGYLVTQSQITGEDTEDSKLQGLIIGGGGLLKSRDLGISVDAEFADAVTLSAMVTPINGRFTLFNGHKKTGIATPRDSGYMEIKVPPRYRLDPYHFINVVLRLGFLENSEQRTQRINSLRGRLLDPSSAREACWELEAIGEDAIPLLTETSQHPNDEIAFYVAHALAYLNDSQATSKLKSLCLKEPAFRAMCLNGLAIIEDYSAEDALKELVHAADPEVKYGAVLALRDRDGSNPEVRGQRIKDAGFLLEIPSAGPPLVAMSLTQIPEVVIFGQSPQLHVPAFQYANERTMVSPTADGRLKISQFNPGKEEKIIICDADLRSALVTLAELGATYGDWVQFTRECHSKGYFIEPFAMNPIPTSGREYDREANAEIQSSVSEPGDAMLPSTYVDREAEAVLVGQEQAKNKSVWNPLNWGK